MAGEHRVHEALPLHRRDDHIVYLVLARVVVFIDDLKAATTFIAIQNVLAGTPEMAALHMQGSDDLGVARIEGEELVSLLRQAFQLLAHRVEDLVIRVARRREHHARDLLRVQRELRLTFEEIYHFAAFTFPNFDFSLCTNYEALHLFFRFMGQDAHAPG